MIHDNLTDESWHLIKKKLKKEKYKIQKNTKYSSRDFHSPHISRLLVVFEKVRSPLLWITLLLLAFLRRVQPLSSSDVFRLLLLHLCLNSTTPGTRDNGPPHHAMHCPDILNLWEGEHPYSPA